MNKGLLLSFLLVFCTGFLVAQSFTIDPVPALGEASLQDDPNNPDTPNPSDVVAHATVTNTSTSVLKLQWIRTEVLLPEEWATGVCDLNSCYGSDVSRESFELQPGQKGTMDVHAYPSGVAGTLETGANPGDAMIMVKLTNLDDPTDTLSGQFMFNVTGNPVFAVSTKNAKIENLKLFPNPTSEYFELSPVDNQVETVAIFNILGRQVNQFNAYEQRFDVSDLPQGFYLVSLMDKKEAIVKTMRLQIR